MAGIRRLAHAQWRFLTDDDLVEPIIARWRQNILTGVKQNDTDASYSLWRDQSDYEIDWTKSAMEIRRFIDAVGYPYEGARTGVEDETIIVQNAIEIQDVRFERRDVGKVWQIVEGEPVVVCGSGLLKLTRVTDRHGRPYLFKRLRTRLRHSELTLPPRFYSGGT